MAKTLENLLAEYGLSEQEKTASAKPNHKSEVNQVLADLGLAESAVEKTAADTNQKEGGHMSLDAIYNEMFGDGAVTKEAAAVEKAPATESTPAEHEQTEGEVKEAAEESSVSDLFGEVVGHMFSAGKEAFLSKIADEQPLAHTGTGGELTTIVGKKEDPHMSSNHSASGGQKLQTSGTTGTSPYTGGGAGKVVDAKIKAILKRRMSAESGDVGAFNQS